MTWKDIKQSYGVRSWRIVKGYPKYRITSCGRVWSCTYNKFVRQDYNLDSYLRVELHKDDIRKWTFVHRLVCDHYKKNPDPKTHTQVNHMDHNRHNNAHTNVEWCTPSMNILHARKKHSNLIYRGKGKWTKISYEKAKELAGTPF